jgi:hypothetical protein
MKQSRLYRRVLLAGLMVSGMGNPAWGAGYFRTVAAPTDSNLPITRFYTTQAFNFGRFPGTLVRLSCASTENSLPGEQPRRTGNRKPIIGEQVVSVFRFPVSGFSSPVLHSSIALAENRQPPKQGC